MRLQAANGSELWLTYCMNVHPGGTVESTRRALDDVVRPLRERLGATGPFGIGLRFDGRTVDRLHDDRELRTSLADHLAGEDLVPFTANAFVVGAFHGTAVKAGVYRPTWEEEARLAYTERFAGVMADLAGPDRLVSLSTAPGSWRPWVAGREREASRESARLLARAGHTFRRLHEATGTRLVLGLEPEPGCTLQTVEEAARFFEGPLADASPPPGVLGLCFDVCHQAVVHDELPEALDRLERADVPVHKVQASSALELADPEDEAGRARLAAFDEKVYLHQVGARGPDGLHVAADLREALDDPSWRGRHPWRVHFHVPVFREEAAGGLGTTRSELDQVLQRVAAGGVTHHVEVETYTWDVLPEAERRAGSGFDLVEALAREITHVRGVLEGAGAAPPAS